MINVVALRRDDFDGEIDVSRRRSAPGRHRRQVPHSGRPEYDDLGAAGRRRSSRLDRPDSCLSARPDRGQGMPRVARPASTQLSAAAITNRLTRAWHAICGWR